MGMDKQFKTGVNRTITFYLIGLVLTLIVHAFWGWDIPHAPPSSFLVSMIFVFIGLLWFVSALIDIDCPKSKGEVVVHLVVLGVYFLVMLLLFNI